MCRRSPSRTRPPAIRMDSKRTGARGAGGAASDHRSCSGSTRPPCTSPPSPAPASPPSAAGRPCRAFPAPRRRIGSRPRRNTGSRCRRRCGPACRSWSRFGFKPRTWTVGRGRRTWHQSDLERALAGWVDRSPPPGLQRGSPQGPPGRRQRVPAAGWPRRGAPSRNPANGATVYPRELLLSGLADALPGVGGGRQPHPADQPSLRSGRGRPCPPPPAAAPRSSRCRGRLQDLFVSRWFHTLGRQELADGLLEAMRRP